MSVVSCIVLLNSCAIVDDLDIRRGKLNSQFIVTARSYGFSDFPKIFRFQIQYSKYTGLSRTLSRALISGRGSGDLELGARSSSM